MIHPLGDLTGREGQFPRDPKNGEGVFAHARGSGSAWPEVLDRCQGY